MSDRKDLIKLLEQYAELAIVDAGIKQYSIVNDTRLKFLQDTIEKLL
jgi:hypothetical protein